MDQQVSFMTVEDDDDLVVSFGLGEGAATSLTLLRTPKYESLLPPDERGVTVGTGVNSSLRRETLFRCNGANGRCGSYPRPGASAWT